MSSNDGTIGGRSDIAKFRTPGVLIIGMGRCGTGLVHAIGMESQEREDVMILACHPRSYEPAIKDRENLNLPRDPLFS